MSRGYVKVQAGDGFSEENYVFYVQAEHALKDGPDFENDWKAARKVVKAEDDGYQTDDIITALENEPYNWVITGCLPFAEVHD